MKKIVLLFSLVPSLVFAQAFQKDLNEQVWKPYILSFNNFDTEAFMALHSKDAVRALRDDGRVLGYDEYSKVTASGNHNYKINKSQRKLELRFNERWVTDNLACEVGVYKTQTIKPSGSTTVHYGKFQVILRKENGQWKILVDSDSSEGGSVTDKDFLFAKPME